jgi:hypothetical protein
VTSALHSDPPAAIASPEAVAAWVYDPWRERPRVAAAALAAAAGLCVLVVAAREPFLVAAGLCLFCIASFAPALAKAECRLDAQGAARRSWLGWERRRWAEVRRLSVLPAGLLLSPYPRPHWLDATRGLTLPLPAARREALLAQARALWEAHGHAGA